MSNLNVGYIGSCEEELGTIMLKLRNKQNVRVAYIYDTEIRRGLAYAEKYYCSFVEDYNDVICSPDVQLVAIESTQELRRKEILDAVARGKNVYVVLSPKTLLDVAEVYEEVVACQGKYGTNVTFSVRKERNRKLFELLPFDGEKLGSIVNVSISESSAHCAGEELLERAFNAVYDLYGILGCPEESKSLTKCWLPDGKDGKTSFSGTSVFKFAGEASGSIMLGGTVAGESVSIYGANGTAIIEGDQVKYRFREPEWRAEVQEKLNKRGGHAFGALICAIEHGVLYQEHTIHDALHEANMMRTLLYSESSL